MSVLLWTFSYYFYILYAFYVYSVYDFIISIYYSHIKLMNRYIKTSKIFLSVVGCLDSRCHRGISLCLIIRHQFFSQYRLPARSIHAKV